MNPYDLFALETGLRLREKYGGSDVLAPSYTLSQGIRKFSNLIPVQKDIYEPRLPAYKKQKATANREINRYSLLIYQQPLIAFEARLVYD